MNKRELDRYRKNLTDLTVRLERNLAHERREIMGMDETVAGDSPIAATAEAIDSGTLEVETGVMANEESLLEECRNALARIDAGTFGQCVGCGADISHNRLDAVPYARHCMKCAQIAQKTSG